MISENTISTINQANTNRYEDGKVVDEYLQEKYHKKRIDIALKFLSKGIKQVFSTEPNENVKIIDIGCGIGSVSRRIYDLGFSVTAADYTIEQISFKPDNRYSVVSFDANGRFPFSDNTFHAVFSGELIEHIFDTSHFLDECKRILKPNGLLILTTPNLAGLDDRIKFLFGITPRHINPLHPYLKLHIRQFTLKSLKKILAQKGFGNVEVESNYLKIYLSETKKIQSRILAKIFPALGGSLICKSQKTI
jgi:2-polyprenyl-3-methyl-5-hydroxy-6-metoxy-1,4-benzoquinol methylase